MLDEKYVPCERGWGRPFFLPRKHSDAIRVVKSLLGWYTLPRGVACVLHCDSNNFWKTVSYPETFINMYIKILRDATSTTIASRPVSTTLPVRL